MRVIRAIVAAGAVVALVCLVGAPSHALTPGYFYQAHVQDVGWMSPVWDATEAGTTGQSLRLEAITFTYPGQSARAHVQDIGWMEPVAGEGTIGTTGQALRLEAVQIASGVPGVEVWCQAHVQDIGWMAPVGDGQVCGTTGQSLRLEAVSLWLVAVP